MSESTAVMGRPPIEINTELCAKVETLAAQGLTIKQIAQVLGMGESTVYEKQANYPEFSEAIEAGRAKGVASITNALFAKARAGDTAAIKYYLNNRSSQDWADRREVAVEGTLNTHEDRLAHLR